MKVCQGGFYDHSRNDQGTCTSNVDVEYRGGRCLTNRAPEEFIPRSFPIIRRAMIQHQAPQEQQVSARGY